jgi:hypothetical protein
MADERDPEGAKRPEVKIVRSAVAGREDVRAEPGVG